MVICCEVPQTIMDVILNKNKIYYKMYYLLLRKWRRKTCCKGGKSKVLYSFIMNSPP